MQRQSKTPLIIVLISLAGCAGSKDTMLPADGPSMKTIYTEHFNDIGLQDTMRVRNELKARPLETGLKDLAGYVRGAFNELDAHFPRLPQPHPGEVRVSALSRKRTTAGTGIFHHLPNVPTGRVCTSR